MEFDSYIDWYNNLLTMPLNDVILGVKDTIEDKTVYLSLSDSKVLMRNSKRRLLARCRMCRKERDGQSCLSVITWQR